MQRMAMRRDGAGCSRQRRRAAAFAVLAGLAAAANAPAAEIVAVETVALTASAAPGTTGSFSALSVPVLGRTGEVAFDGVVDGMAGAWWWSGEAAELVLIEGAEAPGYPGELLDFVGGPELTGDGFALLAGLDTGSIVDDSVLYAPDGAGGLVVLAREGAPVGASGFQVVSFEGVAASDAGVAMRATIETVGGGTNRASLWGPDGAGGLALLARAATSLPGVGGSSWTRFTGPLINDAGRVVSYGAVSTAGGDVDVLVAFDPGSPPALLHRENDPAPGTDATLLRFPQQADAAGLNASGEYAFVAELAGGTLPEGDLVAVYGPDGAGGMRLLAGGGLAMPGTAAARAVAAGSVTLADDGTTVFSAFLQPGVGDTTEDVDDAGLWATAGHGAVHLVMRKGAAPPGIPGKIFGELGTFVANGAGEVLFSARTLDAPGDTSPSWGLWHHDAHTQATSLLLQEGDAVQVAPGDLRTIRSVSQFAAPPIDLGNATPGGSDGKGRIWNDAGQLVAVLRFVGNTEGVFRITVPEPDASAAALAVLATLAVAAARRPGAAPAAVRPGRPVVRRSLDRISRRRVRSARAAGANRHRAPG
jgi:hypothetical protein